MHKERGVYNAYMKLPKGKAEELRTFLAHALYGDVQMQEAESGASGLSSSGAAASGGSRLPRL